MATAAQTYRDVAVQNRRNELILANLGLVKHILNRLAAHFPSGVDMENLESAGTLGLVEAASNFDPGRGIKFETFAAWRIRGAILDELRRNCLLPQHMLERVAKVRKAYTDLSPPVTLEALAATAGLSSDEVSDCLAAMRMSRMISLETVPDPNLPLASPARDRPDSLVEVDEQKQQLARAITCLPERERLVVTLYYLEELRLKEIAEALQLSESRVSRLLTASLFTLGEILRSSALTET